MIKTMTIVMCLLPFRIGAQESLTTVADVRRMIDSALSVLAHRDSVMIAQATHRAVTFAWDTPFDWHIDKFERVECPDGFDNCTAEHYALRPVYGPVAGESDRD